MKLQKLLVQGLLWRGLYFVSVMLVNVVLSRYLQASATGWVFYISNIFGFIQLLLGCCLDAGITFFASGQIIAHRKLVWFASLWSFGVTIVSFAGGYIFFHLNDSFADADQHQYFFFGICYITGFTLTNTATVLFYTKNNFYLPNIILIILNLALIIIIPKTIVAASDAYAGKILYTYFFFFLLQGILLMLSFATKYKAVNKFDFPSSIETKNLIRFSLIALAANVIFYLEYRIDYWFVHRSPVCTDGDLGNYIQVSKLGQMMLVLPQIIASVVYPQSASGINRKELNKTVMIISRLFSQLFLIIFVVIFFTGHWFFITVFGETFNKMQVPFLIIIPGIFSLSVLSLLSAYFSGKGNLGVNVRGAAIALIVMMAGNYFLVPMYGIIAAAAVSTCCYSLNAAYSLRQFYKDYDVNLFDFFKWRRSDYSWLLSLLKNENE